MGITKEHLERIEKQAKVMESFGDAAVGISSELYEIVQDNYQMEQQIEFLLETNDRLRKQLDSDAHMKLPLDADGEPIRIGDVLFSRGNECRVVAITMKAEETLVGVHADGAYLPSVNPKYLSRKDSCPLEPEPADSWEKLGEDAMKSTCKLGGGGKEVGCDECKFVSKPFGCEEMSRLEILKRAKKLACVEEEARNGNR